MASTLVPKMLLSNKQLSCRFNILSSIFQGLFRDQFERNVGEI
jgi:hypothetical protein